MSIIPSAAPNDGTTTVPDEDSHKAAVARYLSTPYTDDFTPAPLTPDRVRTDALQPGDQIRHPHDWTLVTVSVAPEQLNDLGTPLDFHNRATDTFERGMRVTGTDDTGETVHVDTAPSYLWHREGQQPDPAKVDRLSDELTGCNLSLYEEELDTARLRLALASAQRGRRELRARVAELEALKPAPIQTCQSCGAGYDYGQPCSMCEFKRRMAAELAKPGAEEALLARIMHDDEDEPALRGCARLDATAAANAEATHWKRLGVEPPAAPRDPRPGAGAARRMIRSRQLTPMQLLAHDVETAIAPLKGDARAGAEMVLRYIRTLAAEPVIPFTTEDES